MFTGAQMENALSGLRIAGGGHGSRGGSQSFCSNSYTCIEKDPQLCPKRSSFKCYGDKEGSFVVPSTTRPGEYRVTVCDATYDLNACERKGEVGATFRIIPA